MLSILNIDDSSGEVKGQAGAVLFLLQGTALFMCTG